MLQASLVWGSSCKYLGYLQNLLQLQGQQVWNKNWRNNLGDLYTPLLLQGQSGVEEKLLQVPRLPPDYAPAPGQSGMDDPNTPLLVGEA